MLRILCDSPIHKWFSASLAFIFIFTIALSVPAAADSIRPNEPVGWKDGDTFRDILLAVLDSWGISFSKSDSTDEISILEYSDLLLEEFYRENQTTQELFWDLVKYGASETGKVILDFLGVNKIRQFANWLKNKYSLGDNDSVPVEFHPSTRGGFLQLNNSEQLAFELFTDSPNTMGLPANTTISQYYSGSSEVFIACFPIPWNGETYVRCVAFSDYPNQGYTIHRYKDGVSWISNSSPTWEYDTELGFYSSFVWPFYSADFKAAKYWIPSYPTLKDAQEAFRPRGQITINTYTINIPSQDMSPDDGIEIEIPGTNWGDSIYTILDLFERLIGLYDNTQLEIVSIVETLEILLSNLQRSVTVENIPGAVTLDYDEYDIPLETEWGLIDDFYGLEFSEDDTLFTPFDTLKSLIFGLPEPLLLFLSVIIVWIVAYGFIRMGRDSH